MNLPSQPGLHRRLAYSEYIRSRNRRSYNTINRSNNFFIPYDQNETPLIIKSFQKSGLTLKTLLNNSNVYILKNSKFECPICLYQNNSDHVIRRLNCTHEFHIYCIEQWLSNETTCPICRNNLNFN